MKSKKLKIRNLPKNEKQIDHITAKPMGILFGSVVLGFILFFTKYYLIGTILFAMFFYELVCVKDYELVAFYETYAVFFIDKKKENCYIVYYDDILKWDYKTKWNSYDKIDLVFKNGNEVELRCMEKRKFKKYFPCISKNEEVESDSVQKVIL